jgi:CheY-like chemotaxis protein
MSIKLLLADDSITIQKVIGIIFGGEEYSLTIVDNGKAAVEKACEICPDVLLIDALMPGMNGYEVCEAVRATPELAAKPILILTGSFEPFDEDKAKKCGADDFLAKPVSGSELIARVRSLVRVKHLFDRVEAQSAELKALNEDLERLKKQREEISARISRISAENEQAEKQKNDIQLELFELDKELHTFRIRIEDIDQRTVKNRREIESQRSRMQSIERNIQERTESVERLAAEKKKNEDSGVEVRKSIHDDREKLETFNETRRRKIESIRNSRTKIEDNRQSIAGAEARLAS